MIIMSMSNRDSGNVGEDAAVEYLLANGYEILERNWRTRYCEIDIVAQKGTCVYFVEVKRRQSDDWGEGFEYITKKKLAQMHFAAEMWLSNHNWNGESSLAAAAVDGVGDVEYIDDF